MPAALVADRFLALDGGWLDLATGRRVLVAIGPLAPAGDRREPVGISDNDGLLGPRADSPGRDGPALPRRLEGGWWAIDAGPLGADRVFEARDRPPEGVDLAAVPPGQVTGDPWPAAERAVARAVDVWEHATAAVLRRTVVEAVDPARQVLARHRIAREARLRGFVPVCPAAIGHRDFRRAVRGRSLVLVDADAGDGPHEGERRALALAVLAAFDVRLAGCVVWERAAVLRQASPRPARSSWPVLCETGASRAADRGAAGAPAGWPVVRLHDPAARPAAWAAGMDAPVPPRGVRPSRVAAGHPGCDLPAIDRLVARADRAAIQGRPGAALRWLRSAAGLARRRQLVPVMLACTAREVDALVDRGQPGRAARAARIALAEAAGALLGGEAASPGRPDPAAVAASVGLAARLATALAWRLGRAELESARHDHARRVLECARLAASEIGDAALEAAATRQLADLLLEGGDAGTAQALLAVLPERSDGDPGTLAVGLRVALAAGERRQAADLARQLGAMAERLDLRQGSEARETLARYFLDAGAVGAALQEVAALRALARPGRAPAACARYRLLAREVFAALGSRRAPRWLRRVARAALPPGVSPRVRRHVAGRAGHGSRGSDRPLASSRLAPHTTAEGAAMHELLEILRICHEAEDEGEALRSVCGLVRARLGASAVGVWAAGSPAAPLASSGTGRVWPSGMAERACVTGLVLGPEPVADGIEAAAPVRSAGSPLGALACRWPSGTAIDGPRTTALLETAAVASAHLVRAVTHRAAPPAEAADTLGLLGASAPMAALRAAIQRAAAAPFHVLIEGESGSGKELVARALHVASPRRLHRFCALNCAALTDELLEAELFGHARGAFTGALAERPGIFEEAHGGTLFLDEVAELSPRGQAKVLRVLQDGEVRRVGENAPRRVDVRIVAATNRPLRDEVGRGRFREDLRYRLDVIRIAVPPLRERREDIALLAGRFWADATRRLGSRATLDPDLLGRLSRYDWPGNVRELQNVIATLAVHAPRRGRVGPDALPEALRGPAPSVPPSTLDAARRRFEAEFVRLALARAGGRRAEAARALGVTRQGLAKLMARLGLDATTPR
jgi:DNA-binding NtrC family response regulator